MPIKHAGFKALRQSKKRTFTNAKIKQGLKTFEKKFLSLVCAKDAPGVKGLLPTLYKLFDKAARKGVIKPNKARRKKSRLMKLWSSSSLTKGQ